MIDTSRLACAVGKVTGAPRKVFWKGDAEENVSGIAGPLPFRSGNFRVPLQLLLKRSSFGCGRGTPHGVRRFDRGMSQNRVTVRNRQVADLTECITEYTARVAAECIEVCKAVCQYSPLANS